MRKFNFCFKQRKNKVVLNNIMLSLPEEELNFLNWNETKKINLILSQKKLIISTKIDASVNSNVQIKQVNLNKSNKTINLPKDYIEILEIEEGDYAKFIKKDNGLKIEIIKKEEFKKMNGKIITVKANKGGVGKTFLSCQIAVRLMQLGYKVLIITSDAQNDVYSNLTKPNKFLEKPLEIKKGLKSWVSSGNGELIPLRKNLDFIPLESSVFSVNFLKKLPTFLRKKREEYDYIIIDSMPVMKTDNIFLQESDKIIIPTKCDLKTVQNIVNVFEEVEPTKIVAIVPNLFSNNSTAKIFWEKLVNETKGTNILIPPPLKELAKIQELETKGLAIFESEDKILENSKKIINMIINKILEKDNIDYSFDDFNDFDF